MKLTSAIVLTMARAWDEDHSWTKETMAQARIGQVHEHIADENCKKNYITKSKEACVKDGKCYAFGTEAENGCKDVDIWQWQFPDHPDPYRR